ncbi:DMT family transporter [Candidatus Woesearchaeota archaeon]|nr:DMT family transporter [Candidatus Woesearchaeota archaeon]
MIIGILFGIVAMLGYGLSDFFIAMAVKKTNPIKSFFIEMIFIVALVFPFCFWFFEAQHINLKYILIVLGESAIGVVAFLGFLKALEIGKVSIITPLSSTYTIITISIMIIVFGEVLRINQIIGIGACIIGTIFASVHYKDIMRLKFKTATRGINYLLLAIFGWGIYFVILDYLIELSNWFTAMFTIQITSILYLLALMIITKKTFTYTLKELKPIFISAVSSAFAVFGLTLGLKNALTSIVSPIVAAAPVITLILARIILKEKLELIQKIALLTVIIGIVIASI